MFTIATLRAFFKWLKFEFAFESSARLGSFDAHSIRFGSMLRASSRKRKRKRERERERVKNGVKVCLRTLMISSATKAKSPKTRETLRKVSKETEFNSTKSS